MDPQIFSSWPKKIRRQEGVIVGADMTQEWLLPWWWHHYQRHNHHPVAFIDFGLSLEMKEWCKERGELIRLHIDDDFVKKPSEIETSLAEGWTRAYGADFWVSRTVWFKKPFACLQTPFLKTLWIDLDCEIRGAIHSLFSYADSSSGIAMAKEQCETYVNYPLFNSGVISFRSDLELITQWALFTLQHTDHYRADDEVFSDMIETRKISISEIPALYNWSRCQNDLDPAIILHWHGTKGKAVIRNQIHLSSLSD